MKNLFKPEMLKWLISGLVFLLLVKLLWFVVQITLLSAVDIDQEKDHSSKALYYRVKLTPNEAPAPQKVAPVVRKIAGSIKEITLLAIYNASDISVVTIEYKHKSKVLSSGDVINGFTLEGAGSDYAMFSKNDKNYKVLLDKKSKTSGSVGIIKSVPSAVKRKNTEKKPLGEVTNEGSVKIIDRSLLDYYAENMDDIYKNIGISEIKNGKDLQGFKINFVRRDSPFAKLGIRRNDVIKSINGQEIKSYNAAFNVYKNIKNVDDLSLVIQRGKEEMELDYEIN
ncbi:MAG: PDZ domain-containing protein [Epsilonproteobacteria bacterium]|nr:PDZ domain-containing protein [Campylobacterota bacterium]